MNQLWNNYAEVRNSQMDCEKNMCWNFPMTELWKLQNPKLHLTAKEINIVVLSTFIYLIMSQFSHALDVHDITGVVMYL